MLLALTLTALAGVCDDDASSRACLDEALANAYAQAPEAAAELKAACDAGTAEACFHRGVYALVIGKAQDFQVDEAGRATLVGQCKDGQGAACYHLAVLHDQGPMDWRDRSQASMFHRQACGAGEVRGCHAQAVAYASGGSEAGVAKARALFEAACNEQDHAPSCVGLGELLEHSEPAAASAALERACALGDKSACK